MKIDKFSMDSDEDDDEEAFRVVADRRIDKEGRRIEKYRLLVCQVCDIRF